MTDTARFDPEASCGPLDTRIEIENDPAIREILELVRDHIRTEIRGELDGLMATLDVDPEYHFWGLMGSGEGPCGREAVEAFYRNMIAGGGNHFQLDIRRIVADADAVVTECVMRQPMSGTVVLAAGVESIDGKKVSADQSYLAECQVLTIWPRGADGRLKGEDIYMGSAPMARLCSLV